MIDGRELDKPVDHASWGPQRALYDAEARRLDPNVPTRDDGVYEDR